MIFSARFNLLQGGLTMGSKGREIIGMDVDTLLDLSLIHI